MNLRFEETAQVGQVTETLKNVGVGVVVVD